jgi:hypothetical protein
MMGANPGSVWDAKRLRIWDRMERRRPRPRDEFLEPRRRSFPGAQVSNLRVDLAFAIRRLDTRAPDLLLNWLRTFWRDSRLDVRPQKLDY